MSVFEQVIKNPTADKLQAGGKVTGTYLDGLLEFHYKELFHNGYGLNIRSGTGHSLAITHADGTYYDTINIKAYTPPKNPCDDWSDDAWAEGTNYAGERIVCPMAWWRGHYEPELAGCGLKRMHVSPYATTVPVDRSLINTLKAALNGEWHPTDLVRVSKNIIDAVEEE